MKRPTRTRPRSAWLRRRPVPIRHFGGMDDESVSGERSLQLAPCSVSGCRVAKRDDPLERATFFNGRNGRRIQSRRDEVRQVRVDAPGTDFH